ncbi:MAG: hypothetical protein NUW01_00390 [Gemmatimonadaceae bacterium]|nr:hypothetical protein [Gemmatimonadaceae bacterium]
MSSGFDPVQSDRLEVTSETGAALTDFDYRVMASVLKMTHSLRWPKDTIGYLAERISLEGLQIPVSQLSGFSGFTARVADTVVTQEDTTSTASWVDLATVGPSLTSIPDGKYLAIWGCQAFGSVLNVGTNMGISANGATPNIDDACQSLSTEAETMASFAEFTLAGGGANTLTAKYRLGNPGTGSYRRRRLLILRTADL